MRCLGLLDPATLGQRSSAVLVGVFGPSVLRCGAAIDALSSLAAVGVMGQIRGVAWLCGRGGPACGRARWEGRGDSAVVVPLGEVFS